MVMEVVPTRYNTIYLEWKKANQFADECFKNNVGQYKTARRVVEAIETIANYIYKDKCSCIIGHMIMMRDLEDMEQEKRT